MTIERMLQLIILQNMISSNLNLTDSLKEKYRELFEEFRADTLKT